MRAREVEPLLKIILINNTVTMTTQRIKFRSKIELRQAFVQQYAFFLNIYFILEIVSFGLVIIFERGSLSLLQSGRSYKVQVLQEF